MAPTNPRLSLAETLEAEANRRQLSGRAAAQQVGVAQQTWSRWISGDLRPAQQYRVRLIRWLHVSAAEYDAMWSAAAKPKADRSTRARLDTIETRLDRLERIVSRLIDERQ